jgi:hydrogenase maturation protease
MSGRVLIACIGNIFLGDDGFGVEVARRLSQRKLPSGVTVRDFGIRGFDLACALIEPWQLIIMVDAMARGGSPGSIYVMALGNECSTMPKIMDAHGLHPARALELAWTMGEVNAPLILVGTEPDELGGDDGHMGLSSAVENTIEPACDLVEEIVGDFLITGKLRQGVTV